MNLIRAIRIAAVVAGLTAFGGCAVTPEPFEYQPDNELKKGPGLLSGEDGVFTIYQKREQPEAEKAPQ